MKWIKQGLIYTPHGDLTWASHSALQPTPLRLSYDAIRIYAGFRDSSGVSRVGFVDVKSSNPSDIIRVSQKPALDVGVPGAFDENGVVPSAVIEREGKVYLYYAGYQLGTKTRFSVFCGLAISEDGGESFVRYSQAPILDRSDQELFFRVIHSILLEDGVYKIWYGAGSQWIIEAGRSFPVYDIRYQESVDGINFKPVGRICLRLSNPKEHRLGRPYVVKDHILNRYRMFYGVGTIEETYRLGYAESEDGITWRRKDSEIGLTVTPNSWDSDMIGYPSFLSCESRAYLFYNGNNMGKDGFGYAVLAE